MLEECISDHGHERMTMKTMPRPSLEVVEAELLLQLLMGLLTDPSRLDCGSQAGQIHPGGQVGKIVFLLSGHAVLADEPSLVAGKMLLTFVPYPLRRPDWGSNSAPIYTLTFNLNPGTSLGKAIERIRMAESELRLPATVRSSFDGQAQAFQSSAASIPILILTAITVVCIVLGVLYESYIHPLTILSTIPTAGLGALLALLACRLDLSLVASIGIILLIGIVAKNAIMVVDFALEAQRQGRVSASEEAIVKHPSCAFDQSS